MAKRNNGSTPLKVRLAHRASVWEERRKKAYGITDEEGQIRSGFGIAVTVFRKKTFGILAVGALLAVLLAVTAYINSFGTETAVMTLHYENSVYGLTPSGTRYNVSELTSATVLERAIADIGLTDVISVSELKKCITVTAVTGKKPPSDGQYYIPTCYTITYNRPDCITDSSAADMLNAICNAYTRYFFEQYTMNTQILVGDYEQTEDMEYSQIGSFFELRVSALQKYLARRAKESGEAFGSIEKMVENFGNYTLKAYNAYVWENGIAKDKRSYADMLNSRISLNSRNLNEALGEYYIRQTAIEYYNDVMAATVSVPAVSDGEIYMTQAKTGVDYLALDAEAFLDVAEALDGAIATDRDRLSKLKDEHTAADYETADKMIADMTAELMRIEELAVGAENYQAENGRNYITFTVTERGILERISAKRSAILTVLFLLAAFCACYSECYHLIKKGGAK